MRPDHSDRSLGAANDENEKNAEIRQSTHVSLIKGETREFGGAVII